MDSQPERRKDFGKRIEVWWEGDNVYYRGTIFEYSKNTDKHTVYYDDGEKEKVSLATTPHRYECEPGRPPCIQPVNMLGRADFAAVNTACIAIANAPFRPERVLYE